MSQLNKQAYNEAYEDTYSSQIEASRKLWSEVLLEALKDAKHRKSKPDERSRKFIEERKGNFDFACAVIEVNPEKMRQAMMARIEGKGIV